MNIEQFGYVYDKNDDWVKENGKFIISCCNNKFYFEKFDGEKYILLGEIRNEKEILDYEKL
jgi:hypothetical protein